MQNGMHIGRNSWRYTERKIFLLPKTNMRIELTRDNLLAQLPDGDLPDVIVLEGKQVGLKLDRMIEKYPTEYGYFTYIQWELFKRLLQGPASSIQLAAYCNPKELNHLNLVSVHILAMRKKLKAMNAPWEIKHPPKHYYQLHAKIP